MNNILDRYSKLREIVAANFSTHTQSMVDEALMFAAKHLDGQERYNSTPLLDHGVAVARIIIEEIGLGRNSTIAAIIHDVVRIAIQHKSPDIEELTTHIRTVFGEETLGISIALCKISDIKLKA